MKKVAICDAKRTPQGSFQGAFASLSLQDLGVCAINALSASHIDSVYMGCVLQAGIGQAIARHTARLAGHDVPATLVQKVCGSGMKAIIMGAQDIHLKRARYVIAGGMESMSLAPYLLKRKGYRFGHVRIDDHIMSDGLEDAMSHLSMGVLAEATAKAYAITREEQEAYVIETWKRAIAADWSNEIAPLETLTRDEHLDRVNIEKFSKLKGAFGGSITAATASPLSDGACALWLANEAQDPLAWIVDYSEHICHPADFAAAPVWAIQKLCAQLGWSLDEVDAFEINEAFAIVPLIVMKELKIPREKINIKGGACVLGHPLGSSGARIVGTLAHIMKENNFKKGIASICIGGGEAIAIGLTR